MYKIENRESGITLVALSVIIIILLIIAGITIYDGKDLIREIKVQTLETNMLTIKAKAKAYAEEVEAATWNNNAADKSALYTNNYYMNNTSINSVYIEQLDAGIQRDSYDAYEITNETLDKMGLHELIENIEDGEKYIVVYDSTDYNNMDIIYTGGIVYQKVRYYTLSALQSVYGEE